MIRIPEHCGWDSYTLTLNCSAPSSSSSSFSSSSSPGAVFAFPAEGPVPERPWAGDGVTYVNIPISPTSKKQLNYMELEIQETGAPGFRGPGALLPAQSKLPCWGKESWCLRWKFFN